ERDGYSRHGSKWFRFTANPSRLERGAISWFDMERKEPCEDESFVVRDRERRREDRYYGSGTRSSNAEITRSEVTPSGSASNDTRTRCRKASAATACTSSGVTKSRPASHACARAQRSSAIVPRGLAP